MSEPNAAPQPVYRPLFGNAESQAAIDEVIAAAGRTLRIFDVSLSGRGFGSPARIEKLRELIVSGRAHRIYIALHDTEPVERECPRLLMLMRQFPMSIEIHRTLGEARNANDPFVVADDRHLWRQIHYTQPRAVVALHSPQDAIPIVQRFEEIWELSEPGITPTKPGL